MPELTEREQIILNIQRTFDRNEVLERDNRILSNSLKKARQDYADALLSSGGKTPTSYYSQALIMDLAKYALVETYVDTYGLFRSDYISDRNRAKAWEDKDFESFFKTLGGGDLADIREDRTNETLLKIPLSDFFLFIKDELKVRWDQRLAKKEEERLRKIQEEKQEAEAATSAATEPVSNEDES